MNKKITLLGAAGLMALSLGASAQFSTSTVVMPRQSAWKFLDNGSDQGTAWTAVAFNDSAWASGNAELGYGDGNEATTVSFGPSSSNKYPTTYFRKNFTLNTLPVAGQDVVIRLRRDDGAIVYINGTEVVRDNMPATSDYLTWAEQTVDGSNESAFFEFVIPATVLVQGSNTIAVEIHQDRQNSSDISFDLEIAYVTLSAPVVCDTNLSATHISRFVSVMPSAQPDSLRIPSTHTFQMLLQEGDPYTDTAQGVTKGLFDFTGYVPKNNSSKNGYLSINHELGSWPAAGVSMLDMRFNDTTHTWEITNNAPTDFSGIAGTGRNCSGTVTPWNTIITSEETLPTSDNNNDGYQDIGWMVEIDPVTNTIMDYDNDGTPDKIWGMGRMSHENCVVAADNKTVYEGADESSNGFIFKYVADVAGDMSSGQLFVLKLDGPIGTTTTGSWIGIPNSTPAECNNVRSFATSVGATNFNAVEDVEISPLDGKIYFTSKATSRVYRFKDNGMTVSHADVFVGNSDFVYNIQTETGLVPEQWRGGVDNLTFDDEGNLYVIQDGGRNHIWMVPPCHTQTNPAVKLFAVTPAGCEPTGMTFSPDFKFMFVSMQHPSSSNATLMIDATGTTVKFDKESAIVIARKEYLGPQAITPPVSVNNVEKAQLVSLYPNPTTDKITINLNSKVNEVATVRLFDITGVNVRVISKQLTMGNNSMEIDMANLSAGVYNAVIYINGQQLNAKVVKK